MSCQLFALPFLSNFHLPLFFQFFSIKYSKASILEIHGWMVFDWVQNVIRYLLTRIYFVRNLTLNSHCFLMINDHALTLLSKIIWTVFEDRVFFLDQEPCISRPNSEFIWDHSLLVPLKLKRALWFFLTCVWWKKVWVNFKRKVLYFRSSNHTAGEIRPATKSDIEVKTVSVTSVVKFKGTEVTCCRF